MAKRGRPPKGVQEMAEETKVVQQFATDEDVEVAGIIADAKDVDEKEWEKVYLDIKKRGNYYDLVKSMNMLQLPKDCERMQEAKQRRYGWIAAENMSAKCDSSSIFYWTPVNKANHSMLPARMFNRQGGVYKEGSYLCYMPWKMYEARQSILEEKNRLKYDEPKEMFEKATPEVAHFDPTEGGRRSAGKAGDIVVQRVEDTSPAETYDEAGEYVA